MTLHDEALEEALQGWREWSKPPPRRPDVRQRLGSPLAINCTVLLQADDWCRVLKIRGDAGPTYQRSWSTERLLTQTAAQIGLGPAVCHIDDAQGLMLLEWIEPAVMPAPTALAAALADKLTQLHDLELDAEQRDYREEARRYRESLRARLDSTTAAIEGWMVAAIEAADRLADDPLWTVTHHDLSPENLLRDDEKLLLIDWEYACLAHPAFDLACVENLVLSDPDAIDLFYRLYREQSGRPISEQVRADANRLFRFYAAAWQCESRARAGQPATPAELMRLIGPMNPLC